MTRTYNDSIRNGDIWETHLVTMRHIVHGRWDRLREMSAQFREDDDSFCQFVIGQHLTYFVVGRITAEQQLDILPQRWVQTLRGETMRWQEARARLKDALAEVSGALSAADLDYRVLKGIPFAQRYFGDVGLRRWADIDLLVREQDVDRVLGILWGMGYRAGPPDLRMTNDGPAISRATLRKEHEVTLERDKIQVDLHWRFRTAPAYQWRDSEVWAKTDAVCVEGVSYPVLPDEYTLVFLLVSTAHDIARGGCRLKQLLDVHQLLCCSKVELDWVTFLESRKAENTLKISVNMLRMVLDVWDDGSLSELRAAMSPYVGLQAGGEGPSRALELVRSPRGGVENKLWFAKVYGVRLKRDATWMLARSLRHPRRWPLGLSRIIQFGGRKIWQVARNCMPGGAPVQP